VPPQQGEDLGANFTDFETIIVVGQT